MIWIKNIDNISHTWAGQIIQPSSYFMLSSEHQLEEFARNEQFIKDYASGLAKIAYDNSGNTDIDDFISGMDLLRSEFIPQKFEDIIVQSSNNSIHRGGTMTVPAGQSGSLDILMPAKMNYLQGGTVYYKNHISLLDKYNVYLVDKDNILGYGANFVLSNDFIDIPTREDGLDYFMSKFMTQEIPPGLYNRLVYTSTGQNDVIVAWTIFGRKKP